jgi:hypothetical protein
MFGEPNDTPRGTGDRIPVDLLPEDSTTTALASGSSRMGPSLRAVRVGLAILWTLAIMTVCWLPREIVEEVEGESSWFEIPNLDKLVHWGIFAVFSVLWLRAAAPRRPTLWVAGAGVALSAITEVVQILPSIGRDCNFWDFATDVIGVLLGLAAARWVEPLARWVESRILFRLWSE